MLMKWIYPNLPFLKELKKNHLLNGGFRLLNGKFLVKNMEINKQMSQVRKSVRQMRFTDRQAKFFLDFLSQPLPIHRITSNKNRSKNRPGIRK